MTFKTVSSLSILTIICIVTDGQSLYTNPVMDQNHPDPGALKLNDGSGYVVVSTSNYASANDNPAFPLLFSANLVDWQERGHVFPQESWPSWAVTDMWAPEIHFVNGSYHVYFSARKATDGLLAIGLARSNEPFGPFQDIGHPFLEDPLGVIDAHWYRDPRSQLPYFLWKTDDNAIGQASSIYIRQMTEDGLDFAPGSLAKVIMTATEASDLNVVEGPSLLYRQPFYYLIFSGNVFNNPLYHVSVARSLDITGNFVRYSGEEFLHTDLDRFENGLNCTFVGPGHGTPVQVAPDEWWYLYHTWKYELVDVNPPGRVLNLDRIRWTSDDWPVIGTPSDLPMEAPETLA